MVRVIKGNGWMKEKNDGLRRRERKRSDGIGNNRRVQKFSHIKKLVICRIGQRDMGKNEKFSKKFILPPTPFFIHSHHHTTTPPL